MKLAGEVITYKKEEIKRVAKKKNNKKQDEEIPEDIKELLKD